MTAPRYAAYRNSGVKWLGEIPAHWEVLQSRRMFAVRSEPALSADQMLTASQKYGVLFQKDFVEMEGRRVAEVIMGTESLKHVEPDDFIISMRSFQGGLEWSRLRGSTSFHYVMVKPVKSVHPPFFAHLFKSVQYIHALRSTTDLIRDGQELRYSNFVQVDLPLVPIDEQEAIAAFLDRETAKIDALVEEQLRLIDLLKEKRQAVISRAVTKGLNTNVPMKASGVEWLGEVPEHWEVKSIKWLSPVLRGASPRPIDDQKYFDDEGEYAWVRIADASASAGVLQQTTQRLSDLGSSLSVKLEPGSLFVSIAGTVGKPCIAGIKCCIHDGFVYFPRLSIDPKFLFRLFEHGACYAGLGKMGTQLNLNTDTIGSIRVGLPPPDELDAILRFIECETGRFDQLIEEADSAMQLLRERRSALISAAVTGKIDVRGLVPQPEAVAA
jgi:type I restriction enzyme S subunit